MSRSTKYSILTMTRGDELRIKEWLEYHATLGFNDFTIVLDGAVDGTAQVLRSLDLGVSIRVVEKPEKGEYHDHLPLGERWKATLKWQDENADRINAMGLPIGQPQEERQYEYFAELLDQYAASDRDGWVSLIDIDEFIVLRGWESISELTKWSDEWTGVPRIRFSNFNFDTNDYDSGKSVLEQCQMRWSREDIVAWGQGWESRVKSMVRYSAATPLISLHPISAGEYLSIKPDKARLHHFKVPTMNMIPYTLLDSAAPDIARRGTLQRDN